MRVLLYIVGRRGDRLRVLRPPLAFASFEDAEDAIEKRRQPGHRTLQLLRAGFRPGTKFVYYITDGEQWSVAGHDDEDGAYTIFIRELVESYYRECASP